MARLAAEPLASPWTPVAWLGAQIDLWADRYLLNAPSDDRVLHKRWLEAIEDQNQHGRMLWALFVWTVMFTILGLVDTILFWLIFAVAPLTLLTRSGKAFERFGFLNQVVQHFWLAARLGHRNSSNVAKLFFESAETFKIENGCIARPWGFTDADTRLFWGLLFVYTWNEVSVRRFSVMIFHHGISNIMVLVFLGRTHLGPIFSMCMLALFCFRRCWRAERSDRIVATMAREQLHRAQIEMQALQAMSKSKTEFVRTLCHELRNPMTAVQGNCEMLAHILSLQQGQGSSASAEHLAGQVPKMSQFSKNALLALSHMLEVLNETLSNAKHEAEIGCVVSKTDSVHVKQMLSSVHSMFEATAQQKHLDLQLDVPDSLAELVVKSNKNWIKQILINLLSNAFKFTNRGSITTGMRLLGKKDKSIKLEFTVTDTGIGMTPFEQTKLFQPFSQANGEIQKQYGGSGLGLDIVHRVLGQMDGTIRVSSTKYAGSTFTIELPFAVVNADVAADTESVQDGAQAKELPPDPPAAAEATTRGSAPLAATDIASAEPSVLLVDDDVGVQTTLCEILLALGCAVTCASDGEEAISQASEQQFDLILMDINMPVLGGLGAAEAIQSRLETARNSKTPIVGITGEADFEQLGTSGMDSFLTKPVHLATMAQTVRKYIKAPTKPSNTSCLPILVVDDDETVRTALIDMLVLLAPNLRVTQAANGQEAVERSVEEEFAAILMDLRMPVMDGIEAAKRIRQGSTNAGTRIICLSGNTNADQITEALMAGMTDYLAKPYALKDVERVIADIGESGAASSKSSRKPRSQGRVLFRRGD
eukprot:TRINITY_DN5458_c0_g2_i1.p1 TRINITY_DN5458_c0_g2~~TRINITY_DN5458_c0_g2_i1.p1  ORF type:complete len:820 (+),score=148.33 TRINITY_DN5458_c0_g2_i1:254-2713(+)